MQPESRPAKPWRSEMSTEYKEHICGDCGMRMWPEEDEQSAIYENEALRSELDRLRADRDSAIKDARLARKSRWKWMGKVVKARRQNAALRERLNAEPRLEEK